MESRVAVSPTSAISRCRQPKPQEASLCAHRAFAWLAIGGRRSNSREAGGDVSGWAPGRTACQQRRCQKAGECSSADSPAAIGASRSYLRPKTSMMVFVGGSPSTACAWYRPLAFQKQGEHAKYSFNICRQETRSHRQTSTGGDSPRG